MNPFKQDERIDIRLSVPEGWKMDKAEAGIRVLANSLETVNFALQIPIGSKIRRTRIAADITIGTLKLGQQAEAFISVE